MRQSIFTVLMVAFYVLILPRLFAQPGSGAEPIIPDFRVPDDPGNNNQTLPKIAVAPDGSFVVCWTDDRNAISDIDIYAQRYAADGTALGMNFRVNSDNSELAQINPDIAMDGQGNFIIVWQDDRSSQQHDDVYAQRFSAEGISLGDNFMVNGGQFESGQFFPEVAVHSNGEFVVVWEDNRHGILDTYLQRFNADGTPLGEESRATSDLSGNLSREPDIALFESGGFTATWYSWLGDHYNIYMQRYDAAGNKIGDNVIVNDDSSLIKQFSIIAAAPDGRFAIAWGDDRNGTTYDVFAQMYDDNGAAIGGNFQVNDDTVALNPQARASLAFGGDGRLIIAWGDSRDGVENATVYAQRYLPDGSKLANNFVIPTADSSLHGRPEIALQSDRIYTTWAHSVMDDPFDVWTNVLDWNDPALPILPDPLTVPGKIELFQNYPNPFNPTTVIRYSLFVTGFASLKIYDVRGVLVKTAVNDQRSTGSYKYSWDGTNDIGAPVASGVYFYRLSINEQRSTINQGSIARKMILIR